MDYLPGDGRKQNVHTKKWIDPDKDGKIETRKNVNVFSKINISGKQFGKKSSKHMKEYGLDVTNESDRKIFKKMIMDISDNPDYVVRDIEWRGFNTPVKAYIKKGDAVLVTEKNEFITTMKGGADNARIKNEGK